MRPSRLAPVVVLVFASMFLGGCGDSDSNATAPAEPLVARGKAIADKSCMGCHSTNGDDRSGPTWKGLAGSQVTLTDGRVITADDTYLLHSILDPGADQVVDFPKTMELAIPKGSISQEDARAVVTYINSLKG